MLFIVYYTEYMSFHITDSVVHKKKCHYNIYQTKKLVTQILFIHTDVFNITYRVLDPIF